MQPKFKVGDKAIDHIYYGRYECYDDDFEVQILEILTKEEYKSLRFKECKSEISFNDSFVYKVNFIDKNSLGYISYYAYESELKPIEITMYKPNKSEELQRYTNRNIRRSEFMYGVGWQSPGGEQVTDYLMRNVTGLMLKPGKKVLDIGSGLGGTLIYLNKVYKVLGTGIDISDEMIKLATERANNNPDIGFYRADISGRFNFGYFDMIVSRDVLLYVKEKQAAFSNIYGSLIKNGEIHLTDFVSGDNVSKEFTSYTADCEYHLDTFERYANRLTDVGFKGVHYTDITHLHAEYLSKDIQKLNDKKDKFLQLFNEEDYDYLIKRWQRKIEMCAKHELCWGSFVGYK